MLKFSPKKVLVLGSNSFGGACTVNQLLDMGCQVIGASRSAEPHDIFLPYKKNKNVAAFEFHQLDINQDYEKLIQLISKTEPDTILDFAGQGMVAPSWVTPEQWYETNIVAKVKLHNFLKDQTFLKRYLRVSTPEVFGNQEATITEDMAYAPSTPYAVSHAAIDMSLNAFYKHHQFPVIITRFANFYGPSQQLYRIVPRAFISALANEMLPLHGGGTSIRAFIYGDDVAEGIIKSLMYGDIGQAYHFSTDEFISIYDLVQKVAAISGVDFEQFVQVAEERPAKDHAYVMSTEKAQRELEWRPKVNLEQGLLASCEWVRENLAAIKPMTREYVHKA